MRRHPTELASFSDLAEVLVQSGRLDEALAVAEEGLLFGEGSAGIASGCILRPPRSSDCSAGTTPLVAG